MCKTIVVASQKGGVTKTVVCQHLSRVLVDQGYRVLAVDMDAQSNLTASLSLADAASPQYTIYELLDATLSVGRIIAPLQHFLKAPLLSLAGLSGAGGDVIRNTCVPRQVFRISFYRFRYSTGSRQLKKAGQQRTPDGEAAAVLPWVRRKNRQTGVQVKFGRSMDTTACLLREVRVARPKPQNSMRLSAH